jgi:hypothetical protein
MEIIREITQWQVDFRQPNHTYLINAKNQIVAYAKWHSKTDIQVFKSRQVLDKRYRKFEIVKHAALSKIAQQFIDEDTKQKSESVKPSENVRVFNVKSKSKNRTYTVTFNKVSNDLSCGCTGYGYRRTCSHVKAVANKLGV